MSSHDVAAGWRRAPTLGVVICTRNRSALLRGALESLTSQTLAQAAFEVVVIDDGSTDDTQQVAKAFAGRLPLQFAYQRHAGLGSAKNHGLFRTRARLVLFLDDDDVADPSLLEQHLIAHQHAPAAHDAVLGHTRLSSALADDPLMHFVTEVGCFLFAYPGLQHGMVLDYSYFWGGRSSCKRSFLLEHGVFNPVFRFGCEDVELGFRLSRYGLRVVYNADAVSTMVRAVTLSEFCDRLERQGQSNAVFSRLHADEEVQRWTEAASATDAWSRLAPRYETIRRTALLMDGMARRKAALGFDIGPGDLAPLHHAYSAVCRASRLKGIVGGFAQIDEGPRRLSAADVAGRFRP